MKLSVNEIAFLSEAYREKTPLSIFANIGVRPDGSEKKSLEDKNIYLNGNLSPEAKMFDIAAKAERCARIAVKDSSCVVEKYVYRKGENRLLVENDAGELLFRMPEGWSDTLSELSEFTGISRIKRGSFEVFLSQEQLMVLLAVIDIVRMNALNSFIADSAGKGPVSYSDIVAHLGNPWKNSLVHMLKKNYNFSAPETGKIKSLLDVLSEKGCLTFEKGLLLQPEYALFAEGFLIPDAVVIMEAFSLDDQGAVISGSALGVCAGIKDIASFIFSPEGVEFSSISGMQLMQMVENFLNCPDISG